MQPVDYLWTVDELVAATGGTLHGTCAGIAGITNDSRTLKTGELFVALKEERDGHDYVANAHAAGAALSLVSHVVPNGGAQLLVPDTLKALEAIGIAARNRCASAKRIGVTGSVGKTSVTRAIETGLHRAGTAHGPVGSFNNHIGVPLTLARMPRDTQRAVFELGMNHANEITPLSHMVQPQVAIITTVGNVHIENFTDGEAGIARAKAEIFAGLQPGGLTVLNRDNKWFDFLVDEAQKVGARIASFGAHAQSTLQLVSATTDDAGLHVTAQRGGKTYAYTMANMGAHWALNSLAIFLALEATDVAEELILETLSNLTPLPGRGVRHNLSLGTGHYILIDDAYNANPISVQAALATLGTQKGRRIAVLTDMLELGSDAPALHAAITPFIEQNNIDLVFCAGALMQHLYDALPNTQRGAYTSTAAALAPQLATALKAGDVVMIKGSKGSKASTIVDYLLSATKSV